MFGTFRAMMFARCRLCSASAWPLLDYFFLPAFIFENGACGPNSRQILRRDQLFSGKTMKNTYNLLDNYLPLAIYCNEDPLSHHTYELSEDGSGKD